MTLLAVAVEDLFRVVEETDPARATPAAAGSRLLNVAQRLEDAAREIRTNHPRVAAALDDAAQHVRRFHDVLSDPDRMTEWRELHARLAKDYARIAHLVKGLPEHEGRRFADLFPVNYTRNVFHVLSGLTAALMYRLFLDRLGAFLVILGVALLFTTLEVIRHRSQSANEAMMSNFFLRRISRPQERHKVNSATWFAWGVLIAVLIAPQSAVEAGCLVLAFGDPAASNAGRRWGSLKLIGRKSVAGTSAFIAAGFAAVLAFQLLLVPGATFATAAPFALAAAILGATLELISTRLDDNFTIPLGVSIAAGMLLG